MQTGEGKTLTAAMPLYLNATHCRKPVHSRHRQRLPRASATESGSAPSFRFLGLTVDSPDKQHAAPSAQSRFHQADILYGTASEFGFDYLRDNSMAQSKEDQCQRGHFFAIVDEIDSILIDEARTPLIISGPSSGSRQMYDTLKDDVAGLVRHQRDLCNKFATDARKVLEKYGSLDEAVQERKLTKEQEAEEREALRKLWLVGKGTPHNKVLKRIRENPTLRALIEKWDTYYYGDTNKEERAKTLAELLIIVDERSSEFELTDKGINRWLEDNQEKATSDDFVMLDPRR